ncbi:protein of unknown function [Streptococcus thermophilus]|nr:protein of unknown function [Streptococcus thermophilus]CAD0169676.1 protein of unknown function [Streptococcus thermophilus]
MLIKAQSLFNSAKTKLIYKVFLLELIYKVFLLWYNYLILYTFYINNKKGIVFIIY